MKRLLVAVLAFTFNTASPQELKLVLPEGHFTTTKISVNGPGTAVATAGFKESTIAVWDVSTGRLLSSMPAGEHWGIDNLKISPDKKTLVVMGSETGVWDVYTARNLPAVESMIGATHRGPEDIFTPDGLISHSRGDTVELLDPGSAISIKLGIHTQVTDVFCWNGLVFSESPYEQRIWLDLDKWVAFEKIWRAEGDTLMAGLIEDTTYIFTGKGKDMHLVNRLPIRSQEVHFRPGYPELIIIDEKQQSFLLVKAEEPPLYTWKDEKVVFFDWEKRSVTKADTFYSYISSPPVARYKLHEHFLSTGEVASSEVNKIPDRPKYAKASFASIKDYKAFIHESDKIFVLDIKTERLLQTISTSNKVICPCALTTSDDGKKLLLLGSVPFFIEKDRLQVSSARSRYLPFSQFAYSPNKKFLITSHTYGKENEDMEYVNEYSSFELIDLTTGNVLWTKLERSPGNFHIATNDSGLVLLASDTASRILVKLFNTKSGPEKRKFQVSDEVFEFKFLTGNTLVAVSDNLSYVLDASTGRTIYTIPGKLVNSSLKGKGLFVKRLNERQTEALIYDLVTGKLVFRKNIKGTAGALHPDGNVLATNGGELISIPTGTVRSFPTSEYKYFVESNELGEFYFTADGKKLIATTLSGGSSGAHPQVFIWDAQTGKAIFQPGLEYMESFTNSTGTLVVASAIEENGGVIIDLKTRKQIKIDINGGLDKAWFTPDDRHVYTNSGADLFQWKVSTGELLNRIMPMEGPELLVQRPDLYYMSTPGGAKMLHYVTPALEIVSFDQLDLKYNRPDLVLTSAGNTDTSLIRSYKWAFDKRMKRMGIDTLQFTRPASIPGSEILQRNEIPYVVTESKLTLSIKGEDTSSALHKWNIWINESPLFGRNGLALSKKHRFDTTITITLSAGENVIESSVTNVAGFESYRAPLHIRYEPPRAIPERVYFVGIGIDKYDSPGKDLNWSVKDIRDLVKAMKEKFGEALSVDTLFNEGFTKNNFELLQQRLPKGTENDKLIIAYSGHGLLSNNYDYYLSTYNVDFSDPGRDGLPYEQLEGLFDNTLARQKLLLIDACHSGEVDKEEMEKYVLIEKTLEDSGTKSGRKPVQTDGKLGMKNSFELMQELFVNVSRGTGATVISAAAGTQFALERGSLENGVFTYSILEYMTKNPSATVSQLKEYVNKRVSELTNGLQVPTARSETRAVDWRVW